MHHDNPFAAKQGMQENKEKLQKGLLFGFTYFVLGITLTLFGIILWNGAPVLWKYGSDFLTRSPETLEVVAFDAGEALEIPKYSFEVLETYNSTEGFIENSEGFLKKHPYVSFKIEPGSFISDSYLSNIEKDNKKFKPRFKSRSHDALVGFSLAEEGILNLKPELYKKVVNANKAFEKFEVRDLVLKNTSYLVEFKKGDYEMQAKTIVELQKSALIYKLYANLISTNDDKPDELMPLFITSDQSVELNDKQLELVEADTGDCKFEKKDDIVQEIPQKSVSVPKGTYNLPFELFAQLVEQNPAASLTHAHNLEKGVIELDLESTTVALTLPKNTFKRTKIENPKLKLSEVEDKIVEKPFIRFSLTKASELKLPTTDMSAFRIANEGATNENGQKRLNVLNEHVYPYSGGGIAGPIIGTILLVAGCMLVALLIGVAAAVFLGEYSKKGKLLTGIRLSMMNLAGVPSIVFGLFGLGLFVSVAPKLTDTPRIDDSKIQIPLIPSFSEPDLRTQETRSIKVIEKDDNEIFALRAAQQQGFKNFYDGWYYFSLEGWGNSLIAGAFTLAIMVLPIIITSSEESLRAVPMGFREAALALGATKWQSIRTAVLPYATPGILTASVLGITRVAGETAPIMFTAAVAAKSDLPFEGLNRLSDFITQSVQAMPYHIYTVSGKLPPSEHIKPMQYGSVLVFMIIVMGFAALSVWLRIKMRKKFKW